jgi:gluconokinase
LTVIVLMGVSGSGKTTLGLELALHLGWPYQEGDALHPQANIDKMRHGHALCDDDRLPWLEAIAKVIDAWRAAGQSGVVSCSALKRRYRDILIGARPDVVLMYLHGDRATIEARLAHRRDHFMPAALLDSQFAALEEPTEDERPIVLPINDPPEAILRKAETQLHASRPVTNGF